MGLNMIKPFKILSTVAEPEGNTGVHFEVTKGVVIDELKTRTLMLRGYLSVLVNEDVDAALFAFLDEGGWV